MIFRAGPAVNAVVMGALSTSLGLRVPVAVGAGLSLAAWAWAHWHRVQLAHALEIEPQATPAD
jgi:predicted MFS family arabinose efflux permease